MSTFFKVFRVSVIVQASALLLQAITAGILLSSSGGRPVHMATGSIVLLAGLFQLVASILVWKPGGGTARWIGQSVAFVVVEFIQFGLGEGHVKLVHVPLGVLLFGGAVAMVNRVMRPASEATRTTAQTQHGDATTG